MHITVNRKAFSETFGRAAKLSPSSSPKPILTSVKLIADEDNATLMATDLESGARLRVHGVTVHTPGSAILPAAKMSAILSTSRDAELDIRVDGDKLVIRGQQSRFNLPTENPDHYPEVPAFTADAYHVVAAHDLRKLIRRTIASTDPTSTRYALGGCLVELSAESITMVATDGRRLAKMTAPAEAVNDAQPPAGSPVIPVKALKAIDGVLDDPDVSVHVAFVGNSAVLFRTADESSVIYSRLVDGRFPKYADVYPDASSAIKIPLDVAAFRQAIGQASIVLSEESRGVDLAFMAGRLTLASQAADVGSSQVEMAIGHDGATVEITFDPRYLTDALKTIDDGASLVAELIDHKNAAVFRTEDGFSYVVMPLTRDR